MVVLRNSTSSEQVEREQTKSRLLAAASDVFSDRGFHAATIREICQRANVNVALVNYHFGDKLELYTEVLLAAVKDQEGVRGMQELFAEKEAPEVLLRKAIHMMFSLMLRRRDRGPMHMRLLLHELARPTAAIDRVVSETVQPLHDKLLDLLSKILGLPAEDDKTRLCAQSIVGQTIHYAHHTPVIHRLWPGLQMTPEQQAMVADHIADFSLAYLQSFSKKNRNANP